MPICSELALGFSSPLKFQWKIFNGERSRGGSEGRSSSVSSRAGSRRELASPGIEEVVFSLEAMKANSGGLSIPCHLVVTSSALYVISNKEDIQQQVGDHGMSNLFSVWGGSM